MNRFLFIAGIGFFFCVSCAVTASAATTEIVTYLPAQSNSSEHVDRLTVGSTYRSENNHPDGTALISGSLAIGTTATPTGRLHIVGAAIDAATTNPVIQVVQGGTTNQAPHLAEFRDAGGQVLVRVDRAGGVLIHSNDPDTVLLELRSVVNQNVDLFQVRNVSGSNFFIIDSVGNLRLPHITPSSNDTRQITVTDGSSPSERTDLLIQTTGVAGGPTPAGGITLRGGNRTGGIGGQVTLLGGTGTNGGQLVVQGGSGTDIGGDVSLVAGLGGPGSTSIDPLDLGGKISLQAGPGWTGGQIKLLAGNASGGDGGHIFLTAGRTSTGTVAGDIVLTAGDGGNGGNISVRAGVGGPGGSIDLDTSNGVDRIRFASNGNVGIGQAVSALVTTPGSKLVIKGSGSTNATSSLNILNFPGTSLLFVRDDGNVGVGTTNPTSKIQVAGGSLGLGDGTAAGNQPVCIWLTNASGAPRTAGEIVRATGNNSFTTTTTSGDGDTRLIGVVYEPIAAGATGRIAVAGVVTVQTVGAVTAGQYVTNSTTAGKAQGISSFSDIRNGDPSIGRFLETTGGAGSARALLK